MEIIMNSSKKIITMVMFVGLALSISFSFLHKETYGTADTEKEIWDLQIMGNAKGNCKMYVWQSKAEKDLYYMKAEFSAEIESDSFGGGRIQCKLKGTIKNKILSGKTIGMASMNAYEEVSPVSVSGKCIGTFTESEGSGTWDATHEYGTLKGTWKAKKM